LAEDQLMGRQVAIKVVEGASDVDSRALREAQAAAKLDHLNIVTVFEVVRQSDRTLLFTEYVEGHTLRELLGRHRLADAEMLEAGIQICRALEHAHRRGVVHRDIKPENIMLVDGESIDVRIMDFGVARLEDLSSITLDGDLVGTLAYMAPEQLEGRPVDRTADVYALAVTLYEGFTGANPLRGKDPATVIREAGRVEFVPFGRVRADLPATLADALKRGLERDPAQRPSAAEFRRLLEKAGRDMPEPVERPKMGRRITGVTHRLRGPRMTYIGRHLVAGALALATCGYLLPRMPFYPQPAVVPLVAGASFVALLSPLVGGMLSLALLALPAFAFGLGWGVVYLVMASLTFGILAWRRREWAALLPGAAPLLVAAGVGLAIPALAGLLLRRWGPPIALMAGLVIAAAAGFQGWAVLPYTFTAGVGPVLTESRHAASPGEAMEAYARLLDQCPELLLQAVLFGVFGIPLAWFVRGGNARPRLWAAGGYLAVLLVGFVALPPLVVEVSVDLAAFALAFVPCVILVILSALLVPSEGPVKTPEG
jgi:serine/threonine-protein kinase